MEALQNIIENLKERIKTAWAEQQESALFLSIKEKYEELPPLSQKGLIWGITSFIVIVVMWWPLSNLFEGNDLHNDFEERRGALRELMRIQRDIANSPNVPTPPPPMSLKSQFDQKIMAVGIRPDQVKETNEIPAIPFQGTEQKGMQIKVDKITIRQATDLAYEIEHTVPGLKLSMFEVLADATDPHFYTASLRVVTFSPKIAELPSALMDAVKKSGSKKESEKSEL